MQVYLEIILSNHSVQINLIKSKVS